MLSAHHRGFDCWFKRCNLETSCLKFTVPFIPKTMKMSQKVVSLWRRFSICDQRFSLLQTRCKSHPCVVRTFIQCLTCDKTFCETSSLILRWKWKGNDDGLLASHCFQSQILTNVSWLRLRSKIISLIFLRRDQATNIPILGNHDGFDWKDDEQIKILEKRRKKWITKWSSLIPQHLSSNKKQLSLQY